MVFSTAGRYLAKRFTISILGVFFLTLLLIFFVDFIEVLRASSKDDVSLGMLAVITLFRIPIFAELALPFAILIGTIAGFLSLSRTSELTIIRAAGLSVWQFVQPALFVAVSFGIFAVTVYNPIAAALRAKSEELQASQISAQRTIGTKRSGGAWMRQEGVDGASIVQAKVTANRGLTLAGVTVLQYDPNKRFSERIQANKAELRHGYWELENAIVQRPGQAQVQYKSYHVSTYLTPAQVMDSVGSIETLSFWQLPGFIAFAERAGLPIQRYLLQYQQFLSRPLLMAAMVLIAATCSLKSFRFGKIQTMVLTGLTGGFGFFIASELSKKVGLSGLVPVTVAAWAPVLIASLLAVTMLLHQEDG
jgi:lipopolysaccharide export system permease protein